MVKNPVIAMLWDKEYGYPAAIATTGHASADTRNPKAVLITVSIRLSFRVCLL
jgi:hypothetical protein